MYELAKHEFSKWVNTINIGEFTKHDITMVNLLINNFDLLAPLGTAVGKRANKISQLITEKN